MLTTILLVSTLFFCGTKATQDDMSDEDFALFIEAYGKVGKGAMEYSESAGKGCVSGAIGAAPAGFQALCIGCVLGAAGNVAVDVIYPPKREENK